ncbi:MAG TPA: type VI secretion system-associated protein TagF [Amaricoccus sp.]|uniref:type VI secretion system-associated protein TagF n=1 Tax=Amaricoccus sp. TaxID=1872485 RepID=UPI002C03CDBF|nr:type VI secretion system-associated protein TagF [Amaricoccus sp.]HRO10400.1 type VI secretion system-associated protein TagF [Amaricoccus sp.]
MPGPDLILPGFYGKLPQAGDFVTRRLPADFVRFWDRWCARHLAARLPDGPALRFALAQGPLRATGLVIASADRAGRRFPLTLAAPGTTAADPAWLAALAATASAAARGELGPDALDARLRALPLSAAEAPAAPPLALWLEGGAPQAIDPERPEPLLDALLALPAEAR